MCEHPNVERVKKNNGLQETLNPHKKFILANCTQCGTTLVIGENYDGVEQFDLWAEIKRRAGL